MAQAFIYSAALYCAPCGEAIAEEHDKRSGRGPWCEDSNYYPQGPYPDGGGEADSPQHCDSCGRFLENSLTGDGIEYVRESMADGPPDSVARTVWAPFYGLEPAEGEADPADPAGRV